MGSRVYVMQFENVAISAVQDIFFVKAGTANGLKLRYICLGAIGQTSATEFRLSLKRYTGATVTAGSGGSTPTVNLVNDGDTKATTTAAAHANDTSQASSTTTQTLESYTWDVLLPWEYQPADVDERAACLAGEGLGLTLNAAPSSTNCSGTIRWEETP
jgi:hypothetical protein